MFLLPRTTAMSYTKSYAVLQLMREIHVLYLAISLIQVLIQWLQVSGSSEKYSIVMQLQNVFFMKLCLKTQTQSIKWVQRLEAPILLICGDILFLGTLLLTKTFQIPLQNIFLTEMFSCILLAPDEFLLRRTTVNVFYFK